VKLSPEGPASTISDATLLAAAAGVLPGVEVTVVVGVAGVVGVVGTVVGTVGTVGVVGVVLPPLPPLPPQPTANTKAEIRITKPILRTFPPYRTTEASTP
jgi:hypothetical protein